MAVRDMTDGICTELTTYDLYIRAIKKMVEDAKDLIERAADVSCEPYTTEANLWLERADEFLKETSQHRNTTPIRKTVPGSCQDATAHSENR